MGSEIVGYHRLLPHRRNRALLTALFSDVHANLEALSACVDHARRSGAERFGFLGDLVGYGADAVAVIDIVARHASEGAVVIKGNHDAAVALDESYFNHAARAAIDWARNTLSDAQKQFLSSLPLIAVNEGVCYVHATAAKPERWDYIDSPGAARHCAEASGVNYTFCGHVHDQALYFENSSGRMNEFRPFPGTAIPVRNHRRWVAIVGSVGQPRDRNPAAAYVMFDPERQLLTFHRVSYDARAAAEKIRSAGLPESLAQRVELGI